MNLTVNNYNLQINTRQNKKTSFKGNIYSNYIRNIPGNRCGCCGKDMIVPDFLDSIIEKISLPLKEALNNNKMNVVKNHFPNIFELLSNFAQMYPQSTYRGITRNNDNYTIIMSNISQIFKYDPEHRLKSLDERKKLTKHFEDELKNWTNERLKNSSEVIRDLLPIEPFIRGYRNDIFKELEYLSSKYPDKRLSEILKMREVSSVYIENTLRDVLEFAKKRDYHIDSADKIILKKAPDAEQEIKAIHTQIYDFYKHMSDPDKFIFKVKLLYSDLLEKKNLGYLRKELFAHIESLPTNLFTKNTFLSHARRYYSDIEIVNYLTMPFLETEEHLFEQSHSGSDGIYNKITLCRDCNMKRKTIPYPIFLQYHPEMPANTNWQLDFIERKILNGDLPKEARDYPIGVAMTLKNCTNGIITRDTSDYAETIIRQSEEKSAENRESLEGLYKTLSADPSNKDAKQQRNDLELENKKEFEFRNQIRNLSARLVNTVV